jgi:hypothetical protein
MSGWARRAAGIAAGDAEIARLRDAVVALQSSRDDVATLKAAVAELLRERASTTPAAVPAALRY